MDRASKIPKPTYQCLLPIQNFVNPNCKSNVIDTSTYGNQSNIDFISRITIKDVTRLEKVTFSDDYFFQKIPKNKRKVKRF